MASWSIPPDDVDGVGRVGGCAFIATSRLDT
jgi:hypothetical protein